MRSLPDLKKKTIWNLSFGYFGVQIAFTLQTSSQSRVFSTIGADSTDLSLFWLLPALIGFFIQPYIGRVTDRLWINRLGRRKPFLLVGGLITAIVMALLPNAGSFHFSVANAILFGTICIALFGISSNMALQPFRMLPGDLVNEEQKTYAYSVQSFLVNASAIVAYCLPYVFTFFGVKNTAPEGVVPDSVKLTFYAGLVILLICALQTMLTVREMPPEEYALYHKTHAHGKRESFLSNLKSAPSVFWTVGLVQFFCYGAFFILWVYSTDIIAVNVYGNHDPISREYQAAGNWYGIASAVMAFGAVLWSLVIPRFSSHRVSYFLSLAVGAVGFLSVAFVHNQYIVLISYALIGIAWAAIIALPFTILTNALERDGNIGTYLGLFNCIICLPLIIMSILGKGLMSLLSGYQPAMFIVAAVMLVLGACSVHFIKEGVSIC
jgi:maltose/moltooligosaccharide transporter